MPFDINNFAKNISAYGVLPTNKFDVTISMPKFLLGGTSEFDSTFPQILTFRAHSVTTPPIALLTNDTQRFGIGPTTKQPYSAIFGNIPISFLADRNGKIYRFMSDWFNLLYNFSETKQGSNPNSLGGYQQPTYTTNYEDNVVSEEIIINMYDKAGNIASTINLYKAKPILFTGVPLSWEDTDNVVKINTSFTFREWSIK